MNMYRMPTGQGARGRSRSLRAERLQRLKSAGFTLIETMIVVAIIGILAAIAYSSYTKQVVKGNRVAAEGCMSQIGSYMERYYTTYMRYDQAGSSSTAPANTLPALDCMSTQQTGSSYSYSLPTLTATTYQIQATPKDPQKTRDTLCGNLTLDQAGTRGPTTAGCW